MKFNIKLFCGRLKLELYYQVHLLKMLSHATREDEHCYLRWESQILCICISLMYQLARRPGEK